MGRIKGFQCANTHQEVQSPWRDLYPGCSLGWCRGCTPDSCWVGGCGCSGLACDVEKQHINLKTHLTGRSLRKSSMKQVVNATSMTNIILNRTRAQNSGLLGPDSAQWQKATRSRDQNPPCRCDNQKKCKRCKAAAP